MKIKQLTILFLLMFISTLGYSQFRMVSNGTPAWSTIDSETYSASVTFFSDLTGEGFLAIAIDSGYYLLSSSSELYQIDSIWNKTFSSANIRVKEIDNDYVNTEGSPTGQIIVFNSNGSDYVPQCPISSVGTTNALQAATATYNSRIDKGGTGGTDDQTLSLNGTEVTIESGNTIDLAPIIPSGGTDDQTASEVNATDAGNYFDGSQLESITQELGADIDTIQNQNEILRDATGNTSNFTIVLGEENHFNTSGGSVIGQVPAGAQIGATFSVYAGASASTNSALIDFFTNGYTIEGVSVTRVLNEDNQYEKYRYVGGNNWIIVSTKISGGGTDDQTASEVPLIAGRYIENNNLQDETEKQGLLIDSLYRAKFKDSAPTTWSLSDTTNSSAAYITITFDHPTPELNSNNAYGGGIRGNGFPSGGWDEIFKGKSVRFNTSISVFSNNFGTNQTLSVSDILQLQTDGHGMMTHMNSHYNPTPPGIYYLDEERYDSMVYARKLNHDTLGFRVKHINWLGGVNSPVARKVVRNYYESAGQVGGKYRDVHPNPYSMPRMSMDNGNYNDWIAEVDACIERKGYFNLYGHAYTDHWYEELRDDDGNPSGGGDYTWQKIVRLIDYIQAKPEYGDIAFISTIDTAMNSHGFTIVIGDNSENLNNIRPITESEHFSVKKDGNVSFLGRKFIPYPIPNNQELDDVGIEHNADNPPSWYEDDKITMARIYEGDPGNYYEHNFPTLEGYLVTDMFTEIQYWYPLGTQKDGFLYYRFASGTSDSWLSWNKNDGLINEGTPYFFLESPSAITESDSNRITIHETFSGALPELAKLGFYGATIEKVGTIISDRVGKETFQTATQTHVGRNNENASMFVRAVKSDGSFYPWKKITTQEKQVQLEIDAPSIAAHSQYEIDLPYYNVGRTIMPTINFSASPWADTIKAVVTPGEQYYYTAHPNTDSIVVIHSSGDPSDNVVLEKSGILTAITDTIFVYGDPLRSGYPNIVSGGLLQPVLEGGSNINDVIIANPHLGIEAGLTWDVYTKTNDQITLRISNITATAINPVNRQWKFIAIKSHSE
jgi:hypothetical protein